MPKIGRRQQFSAKIPEGYESKNLDRIKLDVALNISVPADLEKKAGKFLEKVHEKTKKMLKDWADDLED